ncbi:ribonuclease III [Mycoplasma sp. 4079]
MKNNMVNSLKSFFQINNIQPIRTDYYLLAITHSSFNRDKDDNYERLEFLGDSLLQFVSSNYIFRKYPELSQGHATRLRSTAVRTEALAKISNELGLLKILRTGPGKMRESVINSPKVQADVFEAMIAAIFLDQGFEKASQFIIKHISPIIDSVHNDENKDPKGQLQEYFQSITKESITYQTDQLSDKRFLAKAKHDGVIYGEGVGLSKKEAETNAAIDALQKLKDKIEVQ